MTGSKQLATLFGIAILSCSLSQGAWADKEEEKQKLAQCAKDLCSIMLSKDPAGPDLSCDLTKTWEEKQLQDGAASKSVSWSLGSANAAPSLR